MEVYRGRLYLFCVRGGGQVQSPNQHVARSNPIYVDAGVIGRQDFV